MVCVQPFGWHEDGTPDFGEPLPLGKPLLLPPGEKEDAPGVMLDNAIRTENEHFISYTARENVKIVENTLYLDGCYRPEYGAKVMIRGLRWEAAALRVDMRMPAGECAGVILRAGNVGARRFLMQGYVVALSPRFGLEILRVDGEAPIRLAIAPLRCSHGDWVTLNVRMQGDEIAARVDDVMVTVHDAQYASGRIGLVADGDLGWFKNMHVEAIANDEGHA